ncbi:zinc finger protein [Pseudovirgaria hyperparasitica]|uniref:Zinc finger protein n=1 Tax=Pseudovirgaria hyperparasitica TaxID=470096 RepID=A0A6A6WDK5_9PEZI|nr:zinc finger protein [Pseudovirgaria hyperparasitica]KAF2760259.1 zinc finger protein [Pseudovirgaria hyperparasitica]
MATLTSQAAPTSSAEKSHAFTCNSCLVAYRTSELQRAHMQTDFHRYNLKRRVASLPPLTLEVFTEKVLANRADAAATAAKASFEKVCLACQKTYYSQNAYTNHLNSSKHKNNVVAKGRPSARHVADASETASMMSSTFSLGEPTPSAASTPVAELNDVVDRLEGASLEGQDLSLKRPSGPDSSATGQDPFTRPLSKTSTTSSVSTPSSTPIDGAKPPLKNCLFCNYTSPTFPLNVEHMSKHHGMFIPEQEYLIDTEGLVEFLYNKIHGEHNCLYCPKILHTANGIQTHMRDLGHCMINFEDEEEAFELGEFYDFTSTWSDADSDSESSTSTVGGGVKVPNKRKGAEEGDGVSSDDGEDEGWETDSSLSDVPSDEITSVPISDRSHRYAELNKSRHHSHSDPRPHRSADGFHSHAHATPHAVYHDEYELHLPSGRTAGHRSLNKYYKQNLRTYPTPAERMAQRVIEDRDADSDIDMDGGEQAQNRERGRGRDQNRQLVSRANGGLGMVGVSDTVKREVRAQEKRDRKRGERMENKFRARREKNANSQKHFRDPLLQ